MAMKKPAETQTMTIYEILDELRGELRSVREDAAIYAVEYVKDETDGELKTKARIAIAKEEQLLEVIQYIERNLINPALVNRIDVAFPDHQLKNLP